VSEPATLPGADHTLQSIAPSLQLSFVAQSDAESIS
jgi:hypothetical protein